MPSTVPATTASVKEIATRAMSMPGSWGPRDGDTAPDPSTVSKRTTVPQPLTQEPSAIEPSTTEPTSSPPKGPTQVRFTYHTTDNAETKLDVPGHQLVQVTTESECRGGMQGAAGAAYIMLFLPNGAEFDGHLVFTGTIAGRTGSLVFRVTGHCIASLSARLKIIPESAGGELRGIHGEGRYGTDNPEGGMCEGELEIEYF